MNEVETIKYKLQKLEIYERELLILKLRELLKKLVVDYKEVNYDYVNIVIEFLREFRDLNDYINSVSIECNKVDNNLGWAVYYPGNFKIEINLYNIKDDLKKSMIYFDDDLKKIFLFARVFITCFHEVEHANQIKMCIENKNTLETVILRNSMAYLSNEEWELELLNKGYNAYELPSIINEQRILEYESEAAYTISPSERLAEIKSSFIAICSFTSFFSKYPYLKKDLIYYLYDALLCGYDKFNSPTIFFIKDYSKINELDKIEELAKKLKPIEKAAYGLYLDKKEKTRLKQKRRSYYL